MFTTLSVQLPTRTLLGLVEQLKRRQGSQDLSEAITTAVEFWLNDLKQFPKTADPDGLRGYQWKCVFLPEGTVLRSWSYGEHNYACVEDDHIIHNGKVVTPNQFARAFARSNRNAWQDLYIRRPGDQQFKLACLLRKEILREQAEARKARAQAAVTSPQSEPTTVPTITAETAPLPASAAVAAAPPAVARDPSPGEGWTLPERRKFRFRLEDIAFD
jgi:hypothetical protein